MQTDGQLYDMSAPPSQPPTKECASKGIRLSGEELLILGLIYLLVSDKSCNDLPLVLALVYILLF